MTLQSLSRTDLESLVRDLSNTYCPAPSLFNAYGVECRDHDEALRLKSEAFKLCPVDTSRTDAVAEARKARKTKAVSMSVPVIGDVVDGWTVSAVIDYARKTVVVSTLNGATRRVTIAK